MRTGSRCRPDALALLFALALVAAACGGGGDGPARSGAADTDSEVEAAPASGAQELVVGYRGDPWVDAETDRKRLPNYPLNGDVCQTLTQLTSDFQGAPSVASDWELVGDNTYRFDLRDDVTFSDGSPLTAEDVKYSLDYTVEEPQIGAGNLGPDSTEVVDDLAVEVTPTQPNLRLLEHINHPTFAILAPGSDPLNDPNVVCTGPFKVAEYVPEERLVVERNDNYWGEAPTLDRITFRFIPDDTTRALEFQTGELDVIADAPRGILPSIEEIPGTKVVTAPVGQVMVMNMARRDATGTERLLADPLVRRAVAHAIDREELVEGVLAGNAELISSVSPPAVFGDHADLIEGIPYDSEESGALLDEAGWTTDGDSIRTKDGEPLQLTVVFSPGGGGTGVEPAAVEFVQSQLTDVGFEVNIDQLEAGAYSERTQAGEYDLNITGPNQNDANPAFVLSISYYSKSPFPGSSIIGPGAGTEFDELVDATQQATDSDELQRVAAEAMHVLIDVEVGAVPLAGLYRIYALREGVQGFEPHPSSTNQRWSTVFLSD